MNLQMFGYRADMLYGERLQVAMNMRSDTLGQAVTRKQIAEVAKCSVQNIGMLINNSKGVDQKLSTESHAAVAEFLRINPEWLLNGTGPIAPARPHAPTTLSPAAIEIAALFDMIPQSDKIRRAQAFNAATSIILQELQAEAANQPAAQHSQKR